MMAVFSSIATVKTRQKETANRLGQGDMKEEGLEHTPAKKHSTDPGEDCRCTIYGGCAP